MSSGSYGSIRMIAVLASVVTEQQLGHKQEPLRMIAHSSNPHQLSIYWFGLHILQNFVFFHVNKMSPVNTKSYNVFQGILVNAGNTHFIQQFTYHVANMDM